MYKNVSREQIIPYFGSLTVTVSAWGINEWLMVIGFLFGAITFVTGQIYQRRRDKREVEAAEQRRAINELRQQKLEFDTAISRSGFEETKRPRRGKHSTGKT
jgi:hypothetical protein